MDQKLLFLINREWVAPWLDWLMVVASSFGLWMGVLGVAVVAALVWGGFSLRACVLVCAVVVGFNDGVVSRSLKQWVGRPRPFDSVEGVRQLGLARVRPEWRALGQPLREDVSQWSASPTQGRSFPSSHTINTTSAAVVFLAFFRRRAWPIACGALLVGYSRVYTGSHWPSDVLVSWFLGVGLALLELAALGALWERTSGCCLRGLREKHPRLFSL